MRRSLMRHLLVAIVPLFVGIAAACSSTGGNAVPGASTFGEATERGPFGVGVITLDLVDTSRDTPAHGTYAGSDERSLPVEVWYPAAPGAESPEERGAALERNGAPYPLILFGHGLPALRRQSASYLQHLASHGYVVASPTFPLTNLRAPGGPYFVDIVNQPGDVSFIIDQFEALAQDEASMFHDAIDLDSIGMTGHSFGGLTALLLAYGPLKEERLKAVLPIAAPGCFLPSEDTGDGVPVLFLAASQDLFVSLPSVRAGFDAVSSPKYFVEIEGADHTRFADVDVEDTVIRPLFGSLTGDDDLSDDAEAVADQLGADLSRCSAEQYEPPPLPLITGDRQRELLRAFATPFFDAYLKGSDKAGEFLEHELSGESTEASLEFVGE